MTIPVDTLSALAALSLLPINWLPAMVERWRAGEAPWRVFDAFAAARWSESDPRTHAALARAAEAVAAAAPRGIAAIAWTDSTYPAALAAIVDPPPVLWLRG